MLGKGGVCIFVMVVIPIASLYEFVLSFNNSLGS